MDVCDGAVIYEEIKVCVHTITLPIGKLESQMTRFVEFRNTIEPVVEQSWSQYTHRLTVSLN